MEDILMTRIGEEWTSCEEQNLWSDSLRDLSPLWRARVQGDRKRLTDGHGGVSYQALENFRRLQILIEDTPYWNTTRRSWRDFLSGGRRGVRKMLCECLDVLKQHGYEELLRKYPCHSTGNPDIFVHQGFRYTRRWIRHIYFIGLMNKILRHRLSPDFVGLDIASSYGIFSYLAKREYPESHQILVDFPEQLILAYYFLSRCFPSAKIAGISQVSNEGMLSKEFVQSYDFVLVPATMYQRLPSQVADLITNFSSFNVMTRTWFEYYLKSAPFRSAQYFFTVNGIPRADPHESDITILDFPIWEPSKMLHFDICPVISGVYSYPGREGYFGRLFYDKQSTGHVFEYIGEI